jgi:hypothetical protein
MDRIPLSVFVVLPIVSAMTTLGQAATAEKWGVGYGMGATEARVENERGAAFEVYCPSGGTDDAAPGMLIDASALTGELEKNASYTTTLRIDEEEQSWSFAYIGGKEFQFVAFDAKSVASLAALVAAASGSRAAIASVMAA